MLKVFDKCFQTAVRSCASGLKRPPFNWALIRICRKIRAVTSANGVRNARKGSVTRGNAVLMRMRERRSEGLHI